MKQLVCEMCGSKDLVKDGGVFVCQSCGCKYSVEEAKKMMIEGTVEVQGAVNITNAAQISSLLKMAQSAYASKNYAKAEEFCDQVIAMDDSNYAAWKLKGEAINFQINVKNPRILEVYNCIMTSYKVLDDAGKDEHRGEILASLKECFEGEIDFWINRIEADRPKTAVVNKAESSFIDSWNKMKEAFETLGFEEQKKSYLNSLDNFFITKAEIKTVSCWKTTVGYNYYRDTFKNGRWTDSDYRPSDAILTTFIEEADNLIALMRFCIKQFNETTRLEDQKYAYSNIAFFHKELINAQSWNRMVSTTTNGYGATISRREYWDKSKSLTDAAKTSRDREITECEAKIAELDRKIKERDERERAEKARLAQEAKLRRIEEYWTEHASEKQALDAEKQTLLDKIAALNAEIAAIPQKPGKEAADRRLEELNAEKKALGVFKLKEKKAVQEKIDAVTAERDALAQQIEAAQKQIQEQIEPLQARVGAIDLELTKDR